MGDVVHRFFGLTYALHHLLPNMTCTFQVELSGRSVDPRVGGPTGWVTVANRVPGPTHALHHLLPNMTYTFLVRAENAHGFSPASPLSSPVTLPLQDQDLPEELREAMSTLSAGHILELTTIFPISSTSIKLGWEVQLLTFNNFLIVIKMSKQIKMSMLTS